jgi:hypothetical protein
MKSKRRAVQVIKMDVWRKKRSEPGSGDFYKNLLMTRR